MYSINHIRLFCAYSLINNNFEYFSNQFSEEVLPNDIITLPKYNCYTKLMIDGMPSPTFSIATLPPPQADGEPDRREKIIRLSRERYCRPREVVEDKIARAWRRLEAVLKPYGLAWNDLPAAVLTLPGPGKEGLQDLLKFAKRREFAWKELSAKDYEAINRWAADKGDDVLTAINEIKNLRPLRDQLYAQRLYAHWFSAVKKKI